MKSLKMILATIVLYSFGMFAMNEENKSVDGVNLGAFAGRVIAYKTDSFYLGAGQGYPIDSDPSVKYGYISLERDSWDSGEVAHGMDQLLRSAEVASNHALTAVRTKQIFNVRLVTSEELLKIQKVLNSGEAKFEFSNLELAKAKLFNSEEAYWEKQRSLQRCAQQQDRPSTSSK